MEPVGVAVKDIAMGVVGLGFDSRVGQIGQSCQRLAATVPGQHRNASLLPRRFAAEMIPATCYKLRHCTESKIKIWFLFFVNGDISDPQEKI